jgi:hypothetical protein
LSNGDPTSPLPSDGASAGSGGTGAADFPCNLYPKASISDLTGFKIATATPVTAVGEPDQKSCLYDTADGSHEFATEIALSNASAHLQTWSLIENTGAAVPDVGDLAWGDDSQLAAVFGSVYVEAGDQSDASNESTPLVHIGIDKLELLIGGLYAATLKG